ncbi:DnaB-like helicase C-terminal domain-containing protein, partial [Acinetobacter baumannii]|nr:DnaB-like helicase C-terminal domain-containing protein [Acinetobacter baumannii]
IQTKFGYSLLDKNIGGVKPGDYTIIGAKSGVGKTTLALNIALNVLEQGKKVLIISREMTDVDVFDRFATMVSKIPSMKFRNKDFTADDWK